MKRPSRPRIIEKLARADLPQRWADLRKSREALAANDLQRALQENELVLHYQPIVDLRSFECRRVEALLRWRSRRGLVHPTELIRIAEDTGQLGAVGRWVVHEAVRQSAEWRKRGLEIGVSVNVAGPELVDGTLVDYALGLIRQFGADPGGFIFEITPRAFHSGDPAIRDELRRLVAAGARVSLDAVTPADVPGRLLSRDLDELKISRDLVRRIAPEPAAAHDARSLIELARDLRLITVAVGVEDVVTRDRLVTMSCDLAQGHWLSRPLAPNRVAPWQRAAVGLAFGGALALTAYVGGSKASAASSGSTLTRAPLEVRGFLPSCCTLELPTTQRATSTSLLDFLRERTGHAFVAETAEGADIYVEASVNPEMQARLANAVDRDLSQVELDYGREFDKRPAIYVFATRSSFALGLQQLFGVRTTDAGLLAAANGGVTLPRQGAIVINLQNVRGEGDLAIVRHELTHALIHQIVGADASLPAWLDEGLATLEERGDGAEISTRGAAVTMTMLVEGKISLDRLESGTQWAQENAALGGEAYTVAAEAARLLRERISPDGLIQIFEEPDAARHSRRPTRRWRVSRWRISSAPSRRGWRRRTRARKSRTSRRVMACVGRCPASRVGARSR
jgi:EAL domain-containing protein (putative c-di-GMP-specific phosphodiesterase class I)